jgi:hypothetical protein
MPDLQSLRLDDEDGTLYVVTHHADEAAGVTFATRRRIGPVDSPWTSYEVPMALLGAFEALADEWADQVADGRAYRRQVERDYRAGSGLDLLNNHSLSP